MKILFGEMEKSFDAPISVFDAAKEAELVSRAHIAALVNGELCSMTQLLEGDAEVKLLTFEDAEYGPDFAPVAKLLARRGLAPRMICESAGTQAEDAVQMKRMFEQACKG